MEPKYKLEEYIECSSMIGWVREIYTLHEGQVDSPSFIYGIADPETESICYLTQEQIDEQS